MNYKNVIAAGCALGFVVLAPSVAFAAVPTTSSPTEESTATPPGNPKAYISVSPRSGFPGQKVTVEVGCVFKDIKSLRSDALEIGTPHPVGPQDDPTKASPSVAAATVKKGAKPGIYPVTFDCSTGEVSTRFTVLAPGSAPAPTKQVAKVPAGAPQTGDGTTDPASDAGVVATLFGAGALAVAGGVGVLAYRRRSLVGKD